MQHELELKLEIDPKGADRLHRLAMSSGPLQVERLVSTYFDTPKARLWKSGWVLRVRGNGESGVQSLKQVRVGAGLFDRIEWESPVHGPDPDLQAIASSPLKDIIKPHQFRHLAPVFRSDFERISWIISAPGTLIEASYDEGEITSGTSSAPVHELELELKEGDAQALLAAATGILRRVPARLGVQSNSERGFTLAGVEREVPSKATGVELGRDPTVASGFSAIVTACLKHFRLNEPLAVRDRDAEALHQLRVAVRRLRTALWLFKPAAKGEEFRDLNEQLKSFTRELGAVRNIDVILSTLPPGDPARSQLEKDRHQLYGKIVRKLGTQKFRLFILDLLGWAHGGEWREGSQSGLPLMPFALKRLDRLWRGIEERARDLGNLSIAERHRLRIDAKKIRYALEFLSKPLRRCGKAPSKFVKAAEGLQDSLGLLNDLATREQLLSPWPVPPEKLAARYLRQARKCLRQMDQIGPFWRRAEA